MVIAGIPFTMPAIWIGLIVISFVIPAIVAWLTSELMRKKGMIVGDDLKIDC